MPDLNRSAVCLFAAATLVSAGGSNCIPKQWPHQVSAPQAPRMLSESPTIDQVIYAVNSNTGRVQSYWTGDASISSPGLPALRADIALERPRRFRLRGSTVLTGPEVDLGSNDEQFWFWVRRGQPPALYHCRHDQFAGSPLRKAIPVDPKWLIEALGLAELDPAGDHSGPRPVRGNRLEVRSQLHGEAGEQVKLTIVDATHGWVLEQHIYSSQGQLVASAVASNHRFDPVSSVSLPGQVEVRVPAAQMMLTIDTGNFQINRPTGDPNQLWTVPSYDGFATIDIGRMLAPFGPSQPSTNSPAPSGLAPPTTTAPSATLPRQEYHWPRY